MYTSPDIESSFSENDLGSTIFNLTMKYKPKSILEVGALHGYSSHVFMQALSQLNLDSTLTTLDMFEHYKYKNCFRDKYINNLEAIRLTASRVNHKILQLDVFANLPLFAKLALESDLVFIDISNDGEKLEILLPYCRSPVLFEGGSKERDNVNWMQKFNKKPIASLSDNEIHYKIIDPRFPSLSLFIPVAQ